MENFRKSVYRISSEEVVPTTYTHYLTAPGSTTDTGACAETFSALGVFSYDSVLVIGSILYGNSGMVSTLNGGNLWRKATAYNKAYQINSVGVVTSITNC